MKGMRPAKNAPAGLSDQALTQIDQRTLWRDPRGSAYALPWCVKKSEIASARVPECSHAVITLCPAGDSALRSECCACSRRISASIVRARSVARQFFETRLTEDVFKRKDFDIVKLDALVLDARKAYHQRQDAVSAHLAVDILQGEGVFDKIKFVDFYRYWSVPLEELYALLKERGAMVASVRYGPFHKLSHQ